MYRDWRGLFYPERLPARRWFWFYSQQFHTVEINNTFYHLPTPEAFRYWAVQAPEGFLFAVKANRFLTHQKKLKDCEEPLRTFLERARLLGPHLGPVLYQLPPRWRCDCERLASFLGLLPANVPAVFEFRDASWYCDDVRRLLSRAGASLCIHDMGGAPCPHWVTGPLVYVRFHGPGVQAYDGRYPLEHLRAWAKQIEKFRRAGHRVWAYFNNDFHGNAIFNARELLQLLGIPVPPLSTGERQPHLFGNS
jgi:uncharacterized protein YecE (DUF72 family)